MTREKIYTTLAEEYNELLKKKKEEIEATIAKLREKPCGTVGNAEKHLEAIRQASRDLKTVNDMIVDPEHKWYCMKTKCETCGGTGLYKDRGITWY